MNIGIVHLSDLHISSKDVIHMEKVNALVNSLQVLQPFDGLIIAFSGDIAARGKVNEYKLAKEFIGSLCFALKQRYGLNSKNIKVLLAPGNHDMNRDISPQIQRSEVEKWYRQGEIDDHVRHELCRMKDFYSFAESQGCFFFSDFQPFTRKVLPFIADSGEKYYVEANIFNSALFSSDNDNGIHHMPSSVYSYFRMWSPAKFSISIMHHSPDWFWPEQKVKLQEQIYSRSNLVLYGHEHYESAQRMVYNNGILSFIQAGGAWWDNGFENSSYYAGVFDIHTREYRQYSFAWNADSNFYEHNDLIKEILPDKHLGTAELLPTGDFVRSLLAEEKHPICSDFSRYYVFPSLQPIDSGDYDISDTIESEEDLVEIIGKTPQLMIIGGNNSGKSTLLRALFLCLSEKYTVLLCGTPDIAGKKQANIIRDVFCNIYGTEPEKFKKFEQQEKRKKIILIDDSNEIKPEHLKKLLNGLSNYFEHIVITSQKDTTFDVREQITSMLELEHEICQLSISRFYADKRQQLIEKLVILLNDATQINTEDLVYRINKALELQNLSFKLDPEFIVQYTSYYCTHANELRVESINVFSKVFEASIELSIMPHLRRETVGQIKAVLSEVAYYIHFHKEYPISEDSINNVVKAYAQKYDENISAARFLEIATASRLLVKSHTDLKYSFRDKDYLAYFVASALSRHFNEGEDSAESDLTYIINYSCFSINSTILKYIAYTTENIRIINLLLQQAVNYVQDWDTYNIDGVQFRYLNGIVEDSSKAISGNERKKDIQAKAENERELEKKDAEIISTVGIYDYDEEDVWELNNQLIRASLQMRVIASSLPTFSHIMPGSIKRELIIALYSMPNKIFHKWAANIDQTLDDLIAEFSEKQYENKQEFLTQEDVKKIRGAMQKLSMNLLLNLYYSIARHSSTLSTIDNLSRSDYVSTTNNRLERLMFYEEANSYSQFIEEAETLYKESKSPMVKNMIKCMIYHILVWAPSLPTPQRHHLMDTFKFKKNEKIYLQRRN